MAIVRDIPQNLASQYKGAGLALAAKELAEKGNVSFGMVSCWEFNEL